MRSTIAIATLASVAAASVAPAPAPVADHGYVNEDVVADGYVDEPIYGENQGADSYEPNDLGVIGEPPILPSILPEECYDDMDEHHDCDYHHVSPKRPIVYETVVHTVISCEEEKVCAINRLKKPFTENTCHQ